MQHSQYLILNIDENYFAAEVSNIEDVIKLNQKTLVPHSSKNINGLSNLRGHVVTEINVSQMLGIENNLTEGFAVVINKDDELYSLAFEGVNNVIEIDLSDIEPIPDTLQKSWRTVSKGLYRTESKLVTILSLELFVDIIINEDKEEPKAKENQNV